MDTGYRRRQGDVNIEDLRAGIAMTKDDQSPSATDRGAEPRTPAIVRVCFVCSGNICRSPMAEAILRAMADRVGLAEVVQTDSAGTGEWHIGERADRRTVAALERAGYDLGDHRARLFEPDWFATRDLVVAMGRDHLRTLSSWAPTATARQRIRLMRTFDPELPDDEMGGALDVPDPYYDDARAFSTTLQIIENACRGLVDHLAAEGSFVQRRRATG